MLAQNAMTLRTNIPTLVEQYADESTSVVNRRLGPMS
jgi:hypothetical protein